MKLESTLIGIAGGVIGILCVAGVDKLAAQATTAPVQKALVITTPVEVLGIPTPQDMLRIVGGSPFTVPSGRLFVVTGLASSDLATLNDIELFINGTRLVKARNQWFINGTAMAAGPGPTVVSIPPGLVAVAGDIVSVTSSAGNGLCLGYLADA